MKLTVKYLKEKYHQYNQLYFDGELFLPRIRLTKTYSFVGNFSCRKFIGKRKIKSPLIEISSYYEMNDNQLRDILVHEMIHFYLAFKHIDHNITHGKDFLNMANSLNAKYGLNVEIRASSDIKKCDEAPIIPYLWSRIFG